MFGLLNPSRRSRILVIRQALHFDKPMVDGQANPLFDLLLFASVALNRPLFVSRLIVQAQLTTYQRNQPPA
jgi:hypothetical protein